jgi:hypothetical protein
VVNLQLTDFQTRQPEARRYGLLLLQGKDHLKQWMLVHVPYGLQLLNQFFKRQLLVRIRPQGHLAHACEQFEESRITSQVRTQY